MEERQRLEARLAEVRDRFELLGPEDRGQLFRAINPDLAPTVEGAWQLLMRLPYQGSYLRKGFRAPRHPACTLIERGKWLSDWIVLNAKSPRDLPSIALGTGLGYGTHHVSGVLLAAAIDAGTAESAAVYGALAGSDTGRHTITALLCSSRPEAWAEVERLLLAAQRQEGLRQVILETVDLAHPEAFRRMLRLIRTEKLTRFASTARAIAVWFGMPVDSAEEKKMNALLDTLIECLDDPERRRQSLSSESADTVYLALWAHAFEDAMAAIEIAAPLLRDPHSDRRYAAVHLLGQLALPEAITMLSDSLADPDLRVAQRAASAFPQRSAWYFPRVNCLDAFERLEALLGRTRDSADRATLAVKLLHYRADRPFSRFEPHLAMFDPDGRIELLKNIQTAATKADGARPIVVALLGDASAHVREVAFKTIARVGIQPDEVPVVERLLSRKASDLRRGAISLLLQLPEPDRRASAERLAASADALMRQAGLEMLDALRAAEAPAPPPTLEDGLGLFNPADRTPPAQPRALPVALTSDASRRLLESLDALVDQHRETTAHWTVGERKCEELLGNIMYFPAPKFTADLPLRDVWENWWRNRPATLRDPDGMELLRALCAGGGAFGRESAETSKVVLRFRKIVYGVLHWLLMEPLPERAPDFLMDAMETTFAANPVEAVKAFSGTGVWMKVCLDCVHMRPELWTDAHWHRLWPLLRWRSAPPEMRDLLQAHRAGAATDSDVIAQLLAAPNVSGSVRNWDLQRLTRRKPDDLMVRYPEIAPLVARVRDRILEVELERGDLPTAASAKALVLSCVYGARLALRILKALGQEPLARGWAGKNEGKVTVLSHLLRVCLPADNDTPAEFRKLAEDLAIPAGRLIDMAVYAPQWAPYVEHTTGIHGLESAAFWIHAHTKDRQWTIDEQIRELWYAQVSERTPLSLESLLDGAVDVNWFHEVYETLGAKQWAAVLDSAKYASGGAGHKRAEQFAQALLGATKASDLVARIHDKRHQDSVRALGLVPLPRKRTATVRERYEAMQAFLKGSKKFGAQQQASDKLAVSIGLENLARTAGFPDAQRLTWAMEAEAVADLKQGPVEVVEGALTVRLEIDALGEPQLAVSKNGKAIKEIPAGAKKSPAIAALRARRTDLNAQSSRMRLTLEESMVRGDRFTGAEIAELLEHPLLKPRIGQLVFVDEEAKLAWAGEMTRAPGELRIAHPVDLLASGDWSRWQQACFAHAHLQPFKQIFRELYVLTEAEKQQGERSRRYEGHQVNPKQAIALLGTRGWVSVPEEGVRRTFHREGLSACVEFLEGFMTPVEVDGLTVTHVVFTRRGDYRPLDLTAIPPRVFSEAMRDLDLMVSVAHRGGVDPEATASTVEMRTALLRETMRLLKIGNVRLQGAHAFIEGTRSSYNVHLGSGVVHRQPGGALCIIPVHSQHRGRIFLPFADDDPKTAEVVSKVLLLAKDEAIQDPTILEQLR